MNPSSIKSARNFENKGLALDVDPVLLLHFEFIHSTLIQSSSHLEKRQEQKERKRENKRYGGKLVNTIFEFCFDSRIENTYERYIFKSQILIIYLFAQKSVWPHLWCNGPTNQLCKIFPVDHSHRLSRQQKMKNCSFVYQKIQIIEKQKKKPERHIPQSRKWKQTAITVN